MKLLVELIIITALFGQVVQCNSELCTTTCGEGRYCKDDDCLPCEPASYQNLTRHRDTFCKPWTHMTDPGWVIKRNGSATEDVQWKCGDQYKTSEYSPGLYECVLIITTSTTSLTTTTTQTANDVTSSTIDPTQTKTTGDKTSPPGDDLLVLYIIILILSVFIAVAIVIFLRCKKLLCFSEFQKPKTEQSDVLLTNVNGQDELDTSKIPPELDNLFHKVIDVIGLGNCQRLLIGLRVSITHNETKKTKEGYIHDLKHWAVLKPNLNHARSIRASLDSIGFKLPPEPNSTESTTVDIERQSEEDIARLRNEDIARLMSDLEKAELLNNAFKRFCNGMVKDLGILNGQEMLTSLNLSKVMEFKDAENRHFQTAFCNTLLVWSYSHPCVQSNNGNQWLPLNKLKETLRIIQRNDILERMEKSNHIEYNDSELQGIIRTYFD